MELFQVTEHCVHAEADFLIFLENVKHVEQIKSIVIFHKLVIVPMDSIELMEIVKDPQQI